MTALQDWLNIRPLVPRTLATLICETLRNQPDEEQTVRPAEPAQPALLRPGLERC